MTLRPHLRFRLQALLGVVGISFSAIFVRLAAVSPSTAGFFRAAYAVPVLLVLWLRVRHRDTRRWGTRMLAILAGGILAADLAAWHRAIDSVGAGLATVLGNTQVFFVAITAWWLYGEQPSRRVLVALPVLFAGVVLTSGLGRAGTFGEAPLQGVLYGLLTGVLYAGFLLAFRRASRDGAPTLGPWLDATIGTLVGMWLLGLLDGELDYAFEWPSHGWLIALALVAQVFGWLLITRSLPRMPAIETSLLLLAQPALTVAWGTVLLDETLSPLQLLGATLIVAGIAAFSIRRSSGGAVRR